MAGSDNRLKTPLAISLNQVGGQRAADAAQSLGKRIPARIVSRSGQIVTVAFETQVGGVGGPWTLVQTKVPIATSSLDWIPADAGTMGYLQAGDFYMGGVSGLGGGTADFSQRGNLSTLVFHPVANKAWTPPGGDADKRVIQGPNGVVAQDTGGKAVLTMDSTNGITLSFGGHTLQINSSGIVLDGIVWGTHEHLDVTTGTDKTGGPTGP